MPKTIRFHELGGPEVLRIEDEPPRTPGKGEVKLKIRASGLNRAESMYYRGFYLEQPNLPSRIGYEVAGIVESVGDGVDRNWLGKAVATIPGFSQNQFGTLGEEAIVPAGVLGEYPPNLTPVQAAAIWMQYITAWGALVHLGAVQSEDFVSIPAASSSVGLAAIQIVRDAGATAIAVTRRNTKKQELTNLGAHAVIASDEEDYVARIREITGGKGVRLTFDPIAGPFVEKLAQAAAPDGIIFQYGLLSGQEPPFPLRIALGKGLSLRGYTLHEITRDPGLSATAKKYIYDRLADGRFVPKIAKTFSFAETIEAYKYLESNQQIGKVVITIP
jgi:NADPH:quinone reductase-like Zn-dependent oxidoreductase